MQPMAGEPVRVCISLSKAQYSIPPHNRRGGVLKRAE